MTCSPCLSCVYRPGSGWLFHGLSFQNCVRGEIFLKVVEIRATRTAVVIFVRKVMQSDRSRSSATHPLHGRLTCRISFTCSKGPGNKNRVNCCSPSAVIEVCMAFHSVRRSGSSEFHLALHTNISHHQLPSSGIAVWLTRVQHSSTENCQDGAP